VEALFNLASVLMSQGRYAEQRQILEQFIRAPRRTWMNRNGGR
jgi:hypothetical protein